MGDQFGEYSFIAGLCCPCQMVKERDFLYPSSVPWSIMTADTVFSSCYKYCDFYPKTIN